MMADDKKRAQADLLAASLLACAPALSRLNAATIGALAFGALAVGSGIFLILELSQPYIGLFRISPAAFEQAIDSIDK